MHEFSTDGFLSEAGFELEAAIRAQYTNEFSRAQLINRECHALLFGSTVHRGDGQEVLAATLFLRALEHFQAVISLLAIGLVAPAQVTLRVMLETVFATRAVASNEALVEAFILADLPTRLSILRKAGTNNYAALNALREVLSISAIDDLSAEIKRLEARRLSAEELSRAAGMHEWYVTIYTLLSGTVHSGVRDLEGYLEIGESNQISSLTYAPKLNEIGDLVHTASHCALLGAAAIAGLFQRDFQPVLETHISAINASFVK